MDVKEVLKWGALILVFYVAWRWINRRLGGSPVPNSAAIETPVQPEWNPNIYPIGVYGVQGYPAHDSFYTSPDGGRRGGRWARG